MKIPLKKYWSLLHTYLRPQKTRILLLFGLLTVKITLRLVNPQIISAFLDQALAGAPLSRLLRDSAAFLAIAAAIQVLTVANVTVGETVAWTATNALRVDLLRHCLRLDLTFHKTRTPGELTERIDSDVDALSNFFSSFAVNIIGNGILAVGILALLFTQSWWLGLIFTVYALAGLYITMQLRCVVIPHWDKLHEVRAQFYGFLGEQLEGTEDIRANGARAYVMQRFYHFIHRWLPIDRNASLAAYSGWMTNAALVAAGECLAYAIAGYLYFTGLISIGKAYLLVEYTALLYSQIAELRWQITDLQHAEAGIKRIQDLFNVHSSLVEQETDSLPPGPLSVTFENIFFTYQDQVQIPDNTTLGEINAPPAESRTTGSLSSSTASSLPDDAVLHNISFDIEAGETLGLLGRTGSGKTTLARLILRLYDPQEGTIRLGPTPLVGASLQHIRQRVSLVTQEVQLFQASVRDNLCFFKPDVNDEEIIRVLDNLGLHAWLQSLPGGLDTELGSGGGGLSAGQAQLLAFARVFLANPDVVIMDEASSRLDPATEQLIENAIDMLLKDRTGIIIAHRLNTVQRVDKILILENGRIQEMGDRAALATNPESHFQRLLKTGMQEVLA
ncbi:MAG: ABC transporter ATP-binding protein [Anaerolineae bacterium]|nr:ABC transporter ATP-binding protein [Anaerolineae bacterium]